MSQNNNTDAIALNRQKAQLIDYLKSKIDAEDFHAVQDAASDIREIDAKLEVLHALALTGGV